MILRIMGSPEPKVTSVIIISTRVGFVGCKRLVGLERARESEVLPTLASPITMTLACLRGSIE